MTVASIWCDKIPRAQNMHQSLTSEQVETKRGSSNFLAKCKECVLTVVLGSLGTVDPTFF